MSDVRTPAIREDTEIGTLQTRFRRSCLSAIKAGLASMVISVPLAAIYFMTLPDAPAAASFEQQEIHRQWKRSLLVPVSVASLIVVPVACATARFASIFPPHPLSFLKALAITAAFVAIAHFATAPIKGPANMLVIFAGVILAGIVVVGFGFRSGGEVSGTA